MTNSHNPELGQWFTEKWLAHRVVKHFGPWDGIRVLETSAGDGALVMAALEAGAAHVTAYEIDPCWAAILQERYDKSTVDGTLTVHVADFLEAKPTVEPAYPFDVVLQNPPYDKGMDGLFLEHSLAFAPENIAITKLAVLAGQKRYDGIWSRVRLTDLRVFSKRPGFSGTATGGRHDMAVIRFRLGHSGGGCDFGHWMTPE